MVFLLATVKHKEIVNISPNPELFLVTSPKQIDSEIIIFIHCRFYPGKGFQTVKGGLIGKSFLINVFPSITGSLLK